MRPSQLCRHSGSCLGKSRRIIWSCARPSASRRLRGSSSTQSWKIIRICCEQTVAQSPAAKSLERIATENRKASNKSKLAITDKNGAMVVTPYRRMDACSVAFLMESVLAQCEPNAMSQPNLKRLMARGKAVQNREVPLELVEFSTGLLPDTPLSGKLATLSGFKEHCLMRHQARGRRAQDLALPPVWAEAGVYKIENISEHVVAIKDRFSEAQVKINAETTAALRDAEDLTIVYNFSESRAALADAQDSEKFVLLHPLFRPRVDAKVAPVALQDGATTPPTKKRCLMLKDLPGTSPASCGSMNDLTERPTVCAGGLDPALGAQEAAGEEEAASQPIDDAEHAQEAAGEVAAASQPIDDAGRQDDDPETNADPARVLNFSDTALSVPSPADEEAS